ncbi:MAG: DNA/RNA non-specific endonuclease [Oscillospiraceae bacterium]|uniref:DNA/RNA non-specific endonuclease n=1 Tax=Methanobrevibacter sp. TaxID=66852 RepID=UPI001B167C5E|nr:DNA/RNA non-specific endonuclease [Methanobrevibacter sp.]MBO5151630.1 DNA/RNA non-specific endonuclease [Methanobrevibacter sp.]MBP1549247.1 DNA/RNA non-specific endonuclease [Oscillospiraceae bacterium]
MSEISYDEVETTDIDDTSSDADFDSDLPDDSGMEIYDSELPDDSGKETYDSELPDDSGKETYDSELPDDSGKETYDSELPDDSEKNIQSSDILVAKGEQFDENGQLKPNIMYKTDDGEGRSYIYTTDDNSRIIKVSVENLEIKNREERLPHDINTPEKKDTDHAGHIIGDQFGGSPKLDNLVSQDAKLNMTEWKAMENTWAEAIKDGKQVSVDIKINYDGDSKRPSSFDVSYSIDGEMFIKSFDNN